jgi:hypothetical protein
VRGAALHRPTIPTDKENARTVATNINLNRASPRSATRPQVGFNAARWMVGTRADPALLVLAKKGERDKDVCGDDVGARANVGAIIIVLSCQRGHKEASLASALPSKQLFLRSTVVPLSQGWIQHARLCRGGWCLVALNLPNASGGLSQTTETSWKGRGLHPRENRRAAQQKMKINVSLLSNHKSARY